jgi:type IV secretion system protein VirD4
MLRIDDRGDALGVAVRFVWAATALWSTYLVAVVVDFALVAALSPVVLGIVAVCWVPLSASMTATRKGTFDRLVLLGLSSVAVAGLAVSGHGLAFISFLWSLAFGDVGAVKRFLSAPDGLGMALAVVGLLSGLVSLTVQESTSAGAAWAAARGALETVEAGYERPYRLLVRWGIACAMGTAFFVMVAIMVPGALQLLRMWCVGGPMVAGSLIGLQGMRQDRFRLSAIAGAVFLAGTLLIAVPDWVTAKSALLPNESPFLALQDIDRAVLVSFLAGFGGLLLTLRSAIIGDEKLRAAKDDVLGGARWMTMTEARELFPEDGYVVVGEAYRPDLARRNMQQFVGGDKRTWGEGGSAQVLRYKLNFDSGHMLFFAGSGGFKTTSTVVPTGLTYPFGMVVLDPALEIGDMIGPQRRLLKGSDGKPRKVVTLDPTVTREPVSGCDVLAGFRRLTVREQTLVVGSYAKMLDEKPKSSSSSDQFFEQNCEKLVCGLLMYIVYADLSSIKVSVLTDYATMRHYAALVLMPEVELQKLCKDIVANEGRKTKPGYVDDASARLFIQAQVGAFATMDAKQWSSIAATVSGAAGWLSKAPLLDMVCGDTFSLDEFPKGNIDVFIQISGDVIKENKGLVRVLIGSMIKAMMSVDETRPKPAGPTLFMLDEVDLLGFMSSLLEARDRGRKFGISLALLYQSVGQLKDHFGESQFGAWFDSAALVSYAVVKSEDGAKIISGNVGEVTVPVVNKSETKGWRDAAFGKNSQRGRINVSTNLQKRALIMPHEVREMRADEQIIFCAGRPALRCGRAIMFRRPEMMKVLGVSRVREGSKPKAALGMTTGAVLLADGLQNMEPSEDDAGNWQEHPIEVFEDIAIAEAARDAGDAQQAPTIEISEQ